MLVIIFVTLCIGMAGMMILYYFVSSSSLSKTKKKKNVKNEGKDPNDPVVLWVSGCYDMFHFGHSNALRKAKKLYPHTVVVVAIHDDEEIMKYKGMPVMNTKERCDSVRSCRWVDKVINGVPWVHTLEIMEKYGITYMLHGDDKTYDKNGKSSFQEIIDAGKFKMVKRTRGVSTTQIINRLLRVTADGQVIKEKYGLTQQISNLIEVNEENIFFPTSHQFKEFCADIKPPKEDVDKIIYVDGTFDLFHLGHVEFLKKAKEFGDYLIVGIHSDELVKFYKGENFPILSLVERALSLLSCRYVDDVILGCPFSISQQMIKTLKIDHVIVGTVFNEKFKIKEFDIDPYEIPKKLGIYKVIESPSSLNISTVIERIKKNSEKYIKRNKGRKSEKEIMELTAQQLEEERSQKFK